MEFMFLRIAHMRGIGLTIRPMDKAYTKVIEVSIMMDSGKMIRSQVLGYASIEMEVRIKENGKMICRADMVLKSKLMGHNILETS